MALRNICADICAAHTHSHTRFLSSFNVVFIIAVLCIYLFLLSLLIHFWKVFFSLFSLLCAGCRYYLTNFLKSFFGGLLFYLVAVVGRLCDAAVAVAGIVVAVVVDGMNNAYSAKGK